MAACSEVGGAQGGASANRGGAGHIPEAGLGRAPARAVGGDAKGHVGRNVCSGRPGVRGRVTWRVTNPGRTDGGGARKAGEPPGQAAGVTGSARDLQRMGLPTRHLLQHLRCNQ